MKDFIIGIIPGGLLILLFIISLIIEFNSKENKENKFHVEFNENGDLMF